MITTTLEVPIEAKTVDFNKIIADSDSMETPPALFSAISEKYGGFNLDVACNMDPGYKTRFYNNRVIADIECFLKNMDGLATMILAPSAAVRMCVMFLMKIKMEGNHE